MKILSKLGALVFLCLFLVNCGENNQKPKEKTDEINKTDEELTTAPKGIISLDEAKILCDNYENRRIPSILKFEMSQNDSDKKFVPTQFIDFDFKTIKKYIKFVEKEARKAKIKPDSLRIYLGNYGDDERDPNRNTVFILPTAKVNGKRGGFFINSKGKAELIRNYWPKDQKSEPQKSEASLLPSFSPALYQGQSFILNRGHGGPPPTGDF